VKKLPDIFSDFRASGVFRLEGDISTKKLEETIKQGGLAFFLLDGTKIHNKEQFLKEAAERLQFPDYFGANWDAFEDCLTDMSWHEADGYVILYDNFEAFAEHSPDQFHTALEIFKQSTEFWRDRKKALLVLVRGLFWYVGLAERRRNCLRSPIRYDNGEMED
jgi:RNAse (barnase) inhibitor barstar